MYVHFLLNFFIANADIRDLTIKLLTKLSSSSSAQGTKWNSIVLIITICCIATTVITSSILIPFLFNLENEEKEVGHKWITVSAETNFTMIKKINIFTNLFDIDYNDS